MFYKNKIKRCVGNYIGLLVLVYLGAICLLGCVARPDRGVCPPFPAPNPEITQELQLCPLEQMPLFYDWLNKLYVLQKQLDK